MIKTLEDFVKLAVEKHGNKYDYTKSIYIDSTTNICMVCPKHGEFYQRPSNHIRGHGCQKCTLERNAEKATLSTEIFIERATAVFGDRYDYSNTVYVGKRTRVDIICPNHGVFTQFPLNHLRSVIGCNECSIEHIRGSLRYSNDEYVQKCRLIHGDKYDYSKLKYKGAFEDIIIICPQHGEFRQRSSSHIMGCGCPMCFYDDISNSRLSTIEYFIDRANLIHNFKYDYSLVKYGGVRSSIDIICRKHGVFTQIANNHLAGSECPECAIEFNSFRRSEWVRKAKNRIGTFYIIRCFNETESFYKYGITFMGLNSRYGCVKDMPYKYEIIRLIISTDKGYIWDLEKRFGRFKFNNRYSPIMSFGGSARECFTIYNENKRTR